MAGLFSFENPNARSLNNVYRLEGRFYSVWANRFLCQPSKLGERCIGVTNQAKTKITIMKIAPYKNNAFNKLYNLLFCDDASLFRQTGNNYPWNILGSLKPNLEEIKKVKNDKSTDVRAQILAERILTTNGYSDGTKQLMGVIVEVGLENGLDVLAAYRDGTARYINHSEKMIVWESPTDISRALVDSLFIASERVVKQIGPWKKSRLSQPENANVRLSFLVNDGLYFGQGPFEILSKDAMGGPVIEAATNLMSFLVEQN
jgi:hypothetical protein